MTAALSTTDQWNATPTGPVVGEPHTATQYRADLSQITENATWLFNRLASILGTWKLIESADATGDTLTITGHGIASNTLVRVASVGGTVPTGLSEGSVYYVIVVDVDTIQLSATDGPGAAVNFTTAGTGTLYLYEVPAALPIALPSFLAGSGSTIPGGLLTSILTNYFISTYGGTMTAALHIGTPLGSLVLDGIKKVTYASRSGQRTQGALLFNNDTQTWGITKVAIGVPGEQGFQDLDLPNGCTLTGVTTYHNRVDTGVLPTTRVTLQVFKCKLDTGVATQIGSTTEDPTAVLASYEAYHGFSITGLSEVIDTTIYNYYVLFNGETGANTSPTDWYGCYPTMTVTSQDEFR